MSQPTNQELKELIESLEFTIRDQIIQLSNLKHEFAQYRETQMQLDKKLIELLDTCEKRITRLSQSNVAAIH